MEGAHTRVCHRQAAAVGRKTTVGPVALHTLCLWGQRLGLRKTGRGLTLQGPRKMG